MTPAPALEEREKYERLSALYLRLWKQIDLVSGESKWLEIATVGQAELRAEAEAILKEVTSDADGRVYEEDFKQTQNLVQLPQQDQGGLNSFRDYLRDLSLRYSQLADEL